MGKYFIPISIIIAGLIIAGAFVFINQNQEAKTTPGEGLSAQEIAQRAIDYINENFDIAGVASLVDVTEAGSGVLKIRLKIGETEYDSYVTDDGKFLFPEGHDLNQEEGEKNGEEAEVPTTQKRDRPDIKLFVMSYCPYGLQAQKMFLPVYNLLADKADMGVYFVNYIMHDKQEIDENLRQYCIQKQQKEKYSSYLDCFIADGDYEKCLTEAGINKGQMENCIFETDREFSITSLYNDQSTWLNGSYPYFDVQTDLNEKYGVRGSPTVVINDEIVTVNPRSPENFKNIVCQSFYSLPEECSQTLSDEVPTPGLGWASGGSSGGQCE